MARTKLQNGPSPRLAFPNGALHRARIFCPYRRHYWYLLGKQHLRLTLPRFYNNVAQSVLNKKMRRQENLLHHNIVYLECHNLISRKV